MGKAKCIEVSDRNSPDKVSNLPDELVNDILTCLPLRDAVRTSILSRKWRYKWTSIPYLILDHSLWKETEKSISTRRIEFAVILYQLMSLLKGPIIHGKVSIPGLKDCPEIDNLLYFLSKHKVEPLDLELSEKGEKYDLPSSVFACSGICHLGLHHWLIKLPPTFEEFSDLTYLELFNVIISAEQLGNLISCCPLLKHLALEIYWPLDHIEVNAPHLRYFYFGSRINSICFTLLACVEIATTQDGLYQGSFVESKKCNFAEFFGSLPAVKELTLDDAFIKSLMTGLYKIPERLPVLLCCLQKLVLCSICLTELDEVCYLLCILKSSPYLDEIQIEAPTGKRDERLVQECLKAEFNSDIQLNQLTKVSLLNIN